MAVVLDSVEVPVQEMDTLNYVRYYIESTTLVEMITSDGHMLRGDFLDLEQFCMKEETHHRQNPKT
eukprot:2436304-Ditylum_brightwellii.AAC.1